MDWEQYAKELEEIIEAITVPDHTRITVDAFVKQAMEKAARQTRIERRTL